MKFKQSESGQTLVLAALSMTVLMGFVAFAANMGLVFREQRNLQIAADAAATAGALSVKNGGSASSDAETAANNNGVTGTLITSGACSGTGTLICVYTPPVDGPNAGTSGFVEVMVRQATPSGLIGMFTGSTTMNVAARAVAGSLINPGCVYALLPESDGSGIAGSGGTALTVNNCNIYDNSSISLSGGASVTAKSIYVVDPSDDSGSTSPAPTQVSSVTNPLASLQAPTVPSPCTQAISASGTYSQGCYSSITVSGGKTVNLNPGLYIVNGDLTVSGGGILNGTGVTFYVTGQINFSGGSSSDNLSAPSTSGAPGIEGILFWDTDTAQNSFVFSGGSGGTVAGIFYAPGTNLNLSGGSGGTMDVALVVGSLTLSGGATLENYSLPSPLSNFALVE